MGDGFEELEIAEPGLVLLGVVWLHLHKGLLLLIGFLVVQQFDFEAKSFMECNIRFLEPVLFHHADECG